MLELSNSDNMLYVHENNIINKINKNYGGKKQHLEEFYKNKYLPMRDKLNGIKFTGDNEDTFKNATKIINDYRADLSKFARDNKISSQSKFESTFLEEISVYLFKDVPEIKRGEFGIFNKGIYAGLKIDNNKNIDFITKDVDFCIGKKANIYVDNGEPKEIILPIVAVEVKTYLDATMFGEVKSSSKSIRSASPNSKAYVLMGYKSMDDEHIVASRQDATLTEMFCLQENENDKIHWNVIYDYWLEITNAIKELSNPNTVNKVGKLLNN